uniref:cytochrome-c oxidase n=1 Tax=Physaloptera rara TaxID=2358290 RepID=A0A4Y6I527_9BILA|nr:cytochrome c oxidase subunit II [Physaloptera rara]
MYLDNIFPRPSSAYSFCYYFVHNHYMYILIFLFFILLLGSFMNILSSFSFKFNFVRNDSRVIELSLQILIINCLILMAGPGFWLIQYQGRMFYQPEINLKVVGHQWYWSYEFTDVEGLRYDSFMKSLDELTPGEARLLDVDSRCVVPVDVNLGLYCTSSDVIHSFALPKCFIKMDALSGILTKITYHFPVVGIFYGQCSEMCGANHSFMPIVLEVTSLECWKGWASSFC